MKKTTYGGTLCYVLLTKYFSNDQTKNTQMSRACSKYVFWWGNPEVRRSGLGARTGTVAGGEEILRMWQSTFGFQNMREFTD
jgi:hypothetical protein